jgi:hypothetical protein
MNLYTRITGLLTSLHKECSGIPEGNYPSIHFLHGVENELVFAHYQLGELTSQKFVIRERSAMACDDAEDEAFLSERYEEDGKTTKSTAADAERRAKLSVGEEKQRKIDGATDYEQHKRLLDSVEHAIQFCRIQQSWVKRAESYPQHQ